MRPLPIGIYHMRDENPGVGKSPFVLQSLELRHHGFGVVLRGERQEEGGDFFDFSFLGDFSGI